MTVNRGRGEIRGLGAEFAVGAEIGELGVDTWVGGHPGQQGYSTWENCTSGKGRGRSSGQGEWGRVNEFYSGEGNQYL